MKELLYSPSVQWETSQQRNNHEYLSEGLFRGYEWANIICYAARTNCQSGYAYKICIFSSAGHASFFSLSPHHMGTCIALPDYRQDCPFCGVNTSAADPSPVLKDDGRGDWPSTAEPSPALVWLKGRLTKHGWTLSSSRVKGMWRPTRLIIVSPDNLFRMTRRRWKNNACPTLIFSDLDLFIDTINLQENALV